MKNKIYSLDFSNKMSAKTTQKQSTLEKKLSEFLSSEQVEQVLELVKSQEKKRRVKVVKDPNAPKRWTSNYLFFCNERRKQIVKDNPEASATEVTVKLGSAWKSLSENEKQRYTQMSLNDKERYQRELEVYNSKTGTVEAPTETKTVSKTRTRTKASTVSQSTVPENKTTTQSVVQSAGSQSAVSEKKTRKTAKKEVVPEPVPERSVAPKSKKNERTPGFRNFSNETREEVESEHPEFSEKKLEDELFKRWNKLPEDQRQVYEVTADEEEEEL